MIQGFTSFRPRRLASLVPWLCVVPMLALAADDVSMHLDRTTVLENETVRLIIEMEGRPGDTAPEYAPLLEDFEILDRTQSTQMEIINGRSSSTTQWIFELAPLRTGEIEIPPLQVGARTAPGTTLTVTPRQAATEQGEVPPLFIETEVSEEQPYVQSQVRLTIRLYQSVNANILDGTLTEPKPADAVVQRLGDDIRYQTSRGGRAYVVIERRYAVFPTASGELEIPPILFDGHVADAAYRQALRDRFFSRGRRTRLRSDPVRLRVRPRAPAFTGAHWLPARKLTLSEHWSESPPRFRVGEPVTRTVTLKATGLDVTQLPELELGDIPGAKVYPDKPATQRDADTEWVYGVREQKLAVVPSRPGTFTLPPIRLAWWDTVADEQRIAELPAREMVVTPAAGVSEAPPPAPATAPPAEDRPAEGLLSAPDAADPRRLPGFGWPALSAGLFMAWLLTLAAWWRQARARRRARPAAADAPDTREALTRLRAACRSGDARGARAALLAWGRATFETDPPLNLGQLARRLDSDALARHCRALDAALYGGGEWDGPGLWRAARSGLRPPTEGRRSPGPLPELYPRRT